MGIRVFSGGGSGGGVWGTITGTLTDQTDLNTALGLKAPLASPTFTGTVTIPTPFTLGAVSVTPTGTELNFVDGVTSAIQGQLDAKLALAGGTMTGGLLFTDNAADIGAAGATRPRTGYFATSVFIGATENLYAVSDGITGLRSDGTTAAELRVFGDGTTATKYASLLHDGTVGILSGTDGMRIRTGTSATSYVEKTPTALIGEGSTGTILLGFTAYVNARTATTAVANTDSLIVYTNEGASTAASTRPYNLPAATATYGRVYTFIVQDADGIRVVAAAGDTIRVIDKVTAAAGYIESTTIGSVVTLVAINATEWIATSVQGVWTDGTWSFDDTGLTTP